MEEVHPLPDQLAKVMGFGGWGCGGVKKSDGSKEKSYLCSSGLAMECF